MGPDADCDYCSLVHWTSTANASGAPPRAPSHLRVVTYAETDLVRMQQQQRSICDARERRAPPPTAADPVLRQFAADPHAARSMVLKFDALKLYVQLKRRGLAPWTAPCLFSEAFAARFARAREARRLVPRRPAEEVWMAVHQRLGLGLTLTLTLTRCGWRYI